MHSTKPGWPFIILFGFIVILIVMDFFEKTRNLFTGDIKEFMKTDPLRENFFSIISKPDKVWLLSEN